MFTAVKFIFNVYLLFYINFYIYICKKNFLSLPSAFTENRLKILI